MPRTTSLFEGQRLTLEDSVELTIESLCEYGSRYRNWSIAYSGGKDSTAVVTLVCHLIETGRVPRPDSLRVFYADTRMELPPLQASSAALLQVLEDKGVETRVTLPLLDHRFFVYMFGRGVPPPSNTFRWCTPKLKVMPMVAALSEQREVLGEKFLTLTGVREGESAARDQRIIQSCSKDGGECGQGWFQTSTPEAVADTLAPLLHWRVCHVWDWLMFYAPDLGFPTVDIAEAYGGDEAEEVNARTGCFGCNLVEEDRALNEILKLPRWQYVAPLKRLRPLYRELKEPRYRLRKVGETRKDGTLAAKQGRLGPLTMEARRYGLAEVLGIQAEINEAARRQGRPEVSLVNEEEHTRILELIEANVWPNKWDGSEQTGDVPYQIVGRDGTTQQSLPSADETAFFLERRKLLDVRGGGGFEYD